jgi:DNA-binding NarL/FixJ family response regulator
MDRTRLLLVDDHVLFREGLSRLLASEPDFELAGSCGTAAEALAVLKNGPVDIVLLDFDLGEEHASQLI